MKNELSKISLIWIQSVYLHLHSRVMQRSHVDADAALTQTATSDAAQEEAILARSFAGHLTFPLCQCHYTEKQFHKKSSASELDKILKPDFCMFG